MPISSSVTRRARRPGRTGVEERAADIEGVVEDVSSRTVAGPEERVSARVEHEVWDTFGVRGGDDRLNGRDGVGQRRHLVFEVHPDCTDADCPAGGLGRVAVAGLEVGGDGKVGRGHDTRHDVELLARG